ncbi:flagellar export protein FliJ [Neisseriaceae bacterium TC5R-5]|nr:flagellar export protein FliJ [Neisseriaceae bacterium TC5R-5]
MAESKYLLLIHLAEDKQKAAAERMNNAQNKLNEAYARMQQLENFRDEYRTRLTTHATQGMGVLQYQDFQRFLGRLNEAVVQQQSEIDRCTQRFLLERQTWQSEYKKLKAFGKLLEREQERALRKEIRLQQKVTDEFAARQFWDASQQTED